LAAIASVCLVSCGGSASPPTPAADFTVSVEVATNVHM